MWRRTWGEKIRSSGITDGKEAEEVDEVKEAKEWTTIVHGGCLRGMLEE